MTTSAPWLSARSKRGQDGLLPLRTANPGPFKDPEKAFKIRYLERCEVAPVGEPDGKDWLATPH